MQMTIKVAQWGTGLVGAEAARKVIEHPEYELVACFAHAETKVGQDVGAIIGVEPIGVLATDRIDDVIAAKPDIVLYMPIIWSVDDMVRVLEAGINLISTANFITGRSYGKDEQARLDAAARAGGVSLYGTGINPGQADILGLVASAACGRIHQINIRESVDSTSYASKDTWVSLGFGGPADAPGLAEMVNERSLVFTDTVEMVAAGLHVELEDIRFEAEFATATEDLDLGWMDIPRGAVCGVQMTYSGVYEGESVINLQLMWRLGYAMSPDWLVEGYSVEIDGEPNVRLSFHTEGDPSGGGLATAMNAVHSIPAVCEARPGTVIASDLPLVAATHSVVPRGRG
ncbi:dihydrodipicolinate reductase [Rhodococcus sp. IEGM 1366]|uniref:NAD(P)H-dependent amine dehydrogenase family protein n=1 Tax=Rhodococcus sp. IEGM 1366 TaxID=3082223 RepID=UPI0029557848|nr:dihydrodipicolinate reductase [Rhodococcus sp. IEGM 1366]MDV8070844.1 dihydrodipicolinate reductase [Rhodococcus sp. IEGM 1366]